MKKRFLLTSGLIVFSALCLSVAAQSGTDNPMTKKEAHRWFMKQDWLGGLKLKPHESIDEMVFAKQYKANKSYWDKAFGFMKEHNLQEMPAGKYPIDGDHVFASVTEDSTKDFDKTTWESHRKYIDLQYIIKGEEMIGVCPVSQAVLTNPYDAKRDAANYSVKGTIYSATPGTFFIFFPSDAHRPSITPGGNKVDKKLVIKVQAAE